ncbi:uncharacterized protein LOC125189504 [Salvia hispanica]|uniref:uncharacterized protein LOC125189504 n=1 Tax=Salvia hispanica TaxID=49212 RepID=UPI0020096C95|nr:uncharacterized protein LOC125189504 [Salvia hispanica]
MGQPILYSLTHRHISLSLKKYPNFTSFSKPLLHRVSRQRRLRPPSSPPLRRIAISGVAGALSSFPCNQFSFPLLVPKQIPKLKSRDAASSSSSSRLSAAKLARRRLPLPANPPPPFPPSSFLSPSSFLPTNFPRPTKSPIGERASPFSLRLLRCVYDRSVLLRLRLLDEQTRHHSSPYVAASFAWQPRYLPEADAPASSGRRSSSSRRASSGEETSPPSRQPPSPPISSPSASSSKAAVYAASVASTLARRRTAPYSQVHGGILGACGGEQNQE